MLPTTTEVAADSPLPAKAEMTTTVVIGSGLSGLAVASELSRRGVQSIVVEGMECMSTGPNRTIMTDSVSLSERTELLRLLRCYASSHALDIRQETVAEGLCMVGHPQVLPGPVLATKKWAVQTRHGVLLADNVVVTKYPHNQLRRFIQSLGLAVGSDLKTALRAIGLYLIGVGEMLTPTTREIVRQAKVISDAIVAHGAHAAQLVQPVRASVMAVGSSRTAPAAAAISA
ncbi:FAD-binding protein [Arthrobacter sp. JZ12]|uniref:FAD-dependent monooxygenase n=1 Tax=Arthrobacter sp. JZ12 TaxID=2654190 RepID=UPI002B4AA1BD|nr:FAD-dependent monooxygenase [Arthrobacter sp. JZ12]WRH23798.1 FAD-binding protein [Arthrobacter sp. JZ12]